jgi:valyl-tRNA synthetase
VFPKRFDYQEAEPRIYRRWKDENAFRTAYDSQGNLQDPSRKDARPFVIVIPPPNITGRLHMGHALNNTVQDILMPLSSAWRAAMCCGSPAPITPASPPRWW